MWAYAECLILLANNRTLSIYSVDLKKDTVSSPSSHDFDLPIVGLEVINERIMFVFHEN